MIFRLEINIDRLSTGGTLNGEISDILRDAADRMMMGNVRPELHGAFLLAGSDGREIGKASFERE